MPNPTFSLTILSHTQRWLLIHPRTKRREDGAYCCPDCGAVSFDPDSLLLLKCKAEVRNIDPVFTGSDPPVRARLGDTWVDGEGTIRYAREGLDDWPVVIEGLHPHVLELTAVDKDLLLHASVLSEGITRKKWEVSIKDKTEEYLRNSGGSYIRLSDTAITAKQREEAGWGPASKVEYFTIYGKTKIRLRMEGDTR